MNISYAFISDLAFYRTASARYRQQRPNRRRTTAIMLIVAVILLLSWMYGRATGAVWTPIPEFALIGGVGGGVMTAALARILLPMRLKRSPSYGTTVSVTLDESGLHATEPHAQVSLAWPAFTRVSRFADGILLVRGRVIRRLPDSALQNSTPGEATAFVRSHAKVVVID